MKKKIVLFSSNGGGGHTSAAQAILHHLTDFQIEIVDMGNLFASIDPFYYATFGNYTGQDIYNLLLKHNRKKSVNLLYRLGCLLTTIMKKGIKKKLTECIRTKKPDMIISIIPMINGSLAECAQQCSIPYLLIPTDLELEAFMNDIRNPPDLFTVAISLDLPEMKQQLHQAGIAAANIKVIGFPIRPSFFERKDRDHLKRTLNVPLGKPVIMLVMGATGSSKTLDYLNLLLMIQTSFHIIICIGRNKTLHNQIKHIQFPDHISYTAVDISYDISDIMAIADLCITKPGTVTFAETLYMNLPVFLDATSSSLMWENFNITFLHKHKLGKVITNLNQVASLVASFLSNKRLQKKIKRNINALEKKEFGNELAPLIKKLLTQKKL